MAKRRSSRRNNELEGAGEFAGPDVDKEAIEKIATARATQESDENAGSGHNGEPVFDQEAWRSASQRTLAETLEIDKLNEQIAECRGRISSIKKTARAQGVPWKAVQDYVADERRIMKGGLGEMITEQRQRGQMHGVMGSALYDQGFFNFGVAADEGEAGQSTSAMDAELQGQHAYANNEPLTNNPFDPVIKTELHNDWAHGWKQAQNANARSMAPGADEVTAH